MKDTYTYKIGDNLYLNLTNRCSNRCTFCVREGATYEGYSLWLTGGEPTADEVIAQIGDPKRFSEVVFCGYGEPTYRVDDIVKIASYVKSRGGKTRLNTNGHGNALNGKNIAPALRLLDGINISLNAEAAEAYEAVCRPRIANAFEEVLCFARACKAEGINCWFSVVDCIGAEAVEKCGKIAGEVGIPLRVREMIKV